jgi:hypothetical protein
MGLTNLLPDKTPTKPTAFLNCSPIHFTYKLQYKCLSHIHTEMYSNFVIMNCFERLQ